MASEDPTHGLSVPEEDGTVSQDHAAPLVLADLMRQLEEGFFTVLTEGVKNEENQTILNERSVGCYEEKNEAAESGVSTVGSDQGFKNEDCKLNEAFTFIDDHTVEQGEDEVSLVENEIQSWRIATEDSVERGTGSAREEEVNFVSENEKEDGDEVQGRILDDLVKQFLCKEEQVCNENEEYDEDSRHREILLSLANWQGCKEKTGDNVVSLAKAERFKKQEVEEIRETQKVDYQKKCRVAKEDPNDLVQRRIMDSLVDWFLCEEEKVYNESEEDSLHRKILLSSANRQGCKEKKLDNENKEEMEGNSDYSVEMGTEEEEEEGQVSVEMGTEDGTISQDHVAPPVLADLMGQLEEGFSTVLTEGVKNEENQTILNERSVGCYEEKSEAAESGVSTAGSDQGFKNEDCKLNEALPFIGDHIVEQVEDEVSLVENEIQSWRIATEDSVERGTGSAREEEENFVNENEKEDGDEVQGRILDDLAKRFLCKEEQVCNENEEDDEDSRHREILLSLANWQGCKEKTGDNVVSLAKAERFKKEEVEEIRETQKVDYQKKCRVAKEDPNDLVQRRIMDSLVDWFLCEEEKVYNESEEDSLHRRILLSAANRQGCKEKKLDNENKEEKKGNSDYSVEMGTEEEEEEEDQVSLQRRIPDSSVNRHGCEEENVDNETVDSLAEAERLKKEEVKEMREIRNNEMDVKEVTEDASMSNQISRELGEIESALENENRAWDLLRIRAARQLDMLAWMAETEGQHESNSKEGVEPQKSREPEVAESQQENEVKEKINCCFCS